MQTNNIYRNIRSIINLSFLACDLYVIKPGSGERKHYHKGIEIVYVTNGNCKTHKKGH